MSILIPIAVSLSLAAVSSMNQEGSSRPVLERNVGVWKGEKMQWTTIRLPPQRNPVATACELYEAGAEVWVPEATSALVQIDAYGSTKSRVEKASADLQDLLARSLRRIGSPPDERNRPVDPLIPWIDLKWKKGELRDYATGLRLSEPYGMVIPCLSEIVDYLSAVRVPDLYSRTYREIAIRSWAWHQKNANNPSGPTTHQVEDTVVYEFPDGWAIVQLDSKEQISYEGASMQHCIAKVYTGEILSKKMNAFSLRSPKGIPKVTIGFGATGRSRMSKGEGILFPLPSIVLTCSSSCGPEFRTSSFGLGMPGRSQRSAQSCREQRFQSLKVVRFGASR